MQHFKSEFVHSYQTYSFGYTEYAIREGGDTLEKLYGLGFLPYSASPGVRDRMYMARSARINLSHFKLNSENRRIRRRFDGQFERITTPLREFAYTNESFTNFCTNYFATRHGAGVMPKERLLTILESGFVSDVITYRKDGIATGYVLEVNERSTGHYWFSFYDLEYVNQSLGMWLMIDGVRHAKQAGRKYYYIGTVYGEKALYKTNFDALEYWDGNKWSANVKKLKELGRTDSERVIDVYDEWKRDLPRF